MVKSLIFLNNKMETNNFKNSILQRLDSINIENNLNKLTNDLTVDVNTDITKDIDILKESVQYLAKEVQKIYNYLKKEQDRRLKNATLINNLVDANK